MLAIMDESPKCKYARCAPPILRLLSNNERRIALRRSSFKDRRHRLHPARRELPVFSAGIQEYVARLLDCQNMGPVVNDYSFELTENVATENSIVFIRQP